jgi:hypothetical protein
MIPPLSNHGKSSKYAMETPFLSQLCEISPNHLRGHHRHQWTFKDPDITINTKHYYEPSKTFILPSRESILAYS